ncbi:phytoene desaturase family protein [Nocardioides taihuensis]|uniref:Pyridine nucleotide-disulfide oxidoreductase domain-containing protein 2 n=1 Tax=Nocardioides taihuensis TaxID=1835606 RepID=A0ABW0BJX0_9ACTN
MTRAHDAIVVGAGPNGLVAANLLADRGWSVLLLEQQPQVGGAVASAEDVHPGFVHDTFSAFYPLGAASPTIRGLDLERHGLTWRHAPAVLGHPLPDGSWALLHRDRERTAAGLEARHPGDGEAWLTLCSDWDAVADHLVGALLTPFPPVRHGLGLLPRLRKVGGLRFAQTLLTPAVELGRNRFGGEHARILLAGNAGHADIPLTAPGSGLIALLLVMLGQTVGFPVPEGGAGRLATALRDRFTSLGGEVRCEAEVTRVVVDRGRATGVRLADGTSYDARRAVLADVAAPHLFGGLVAADDLPARVAHGMRGFTMDPGTVKVDWALDRPVPWASPPEVAPGTVHVADSVEDMSESLDQVNAGTVPDRPFMLAGQMTTSDPSRSPAGTESLWAYTHVPQGSTHDPADRDRVADLMQARFERLAPGFGDAVLSRRVLGPVDLEARNANLVGGAVGGGSAQLHQQLVFRPVPGLGRAETGIAGLYLASASAHPGGGVHGACGSNAARAALLHDRVRRLTPSAGRRGR